MKKLPNILTWFRMAMIPVLLYLLAQDQEWSNWVSFILFFFVAVTDYLDGYIARKYQASTILGMFLDPLADKLLVLATLIVLLDLNRVYMILVIVSLLRELGIQGLRTLAAEQNLKIPSSPGGKMKTSFQLFGIGFLVVGVSFDVFFEKLTGYPAYSLYVGNLFLLVSLIFSLESAFQYIYRFSKMGKWM